MADQYFASCEAVILVAGSPSNIGDSVILDVTSTGGARRINLNEMGISFNGTSSSAVPVIVRLIRTTNATTPVSSSSALLQSPTPLDPASPTSTCTAYAPSTASPGIYTTRPTIGATLRTWFVPPTSGLVIQYPLGQEPDGPAQSVAGLAIQCIAPAGVTTNAYMVWTE